MMVHLGVQRPLGQGLLQIVQKAIGISPSWDLRRPEAGPECAVIRVVPSETSIRSTMAAPHTKSLTVLLGLAVRFLIISNSSG